MAATAGPSLCALVPTLDEAERLPELLARLRSGADDDRADEVIVADGGSSDGTRSVAAAGGARVLLAPRGRGTQLARGAAQASAELLLVLHADCLPRPGALAALRRAFDDPRLDFAAMRQRIDDPGTLFRAIERASSLRSGLLGIVYGDCGLCVRRSAYEGAGGFRDLPLFEDLDLSRRLARRGRGRLVRDAELLVSARRWRREGPLRCTLRNWILTLAWLAGVAPERLARHYSPNGRGPGAAGSGRDQRSGASRPPSSSP